MPANNISGPVAALMERNANSEVYRLPRNYEQNGCPIMWEKVRPDQVKMAETDWALFQEREAKRLEFTTPLMGDLVRMPGGDLFRISVLYGHEETGTTFQAAYGGSCHLFSSGRSDFSGTCGDQYKASGLKPTEEFQLADFWIFSQGSSGGGRGIWSKIKTRVWEYRP